ncbi:hypothetical protein EVAR_102456_1 [Eumeta japonica]|uniref:Uncharacterized protein n=1 Tax=Eumeta variegata TaxID=151549 RepID=A0A4C1ZUG5_EUMVA|nr:hypothetical protein EVAR_102456_1 [Eumeta japonica]
MLGQMRVPEALAEIRKVVARPAPRIMNYAEAAAKPRQRRREALASFLYRTHPHRGFQFENHTAEHVITKLRGWWMPGRGGRGPDEEGQGTKVNSDEDIVRSLRTQNRHLSEGLDWDKVRARVCYRRRARNDLECHPVLEVSPELYHRLIKAGLYTWLQRRPVWDQSPLVQCSRCLGYGHGKRYCKEVSESARTAAGSTLA